MGSSLPHKSWIKFFKIHRTKRPPLSSYMVVHPEKCTHKYNSIKIYGSQSLYHVLNSIQWPMFFGSAGFNAPLRTPSLSRDTQINRPWFDSPTPLFSFSPPNHVPSDRKRCTLSTLSSLSSAIVERGEKGATAVSGGGSAGLLHLRRPGRRRRGWRPGEVPCGCT